MTTGKTYPVATLQDIAAIPADALPRFLAELPTMLETVRLFVDMPPEIALRRMVWRDDGKTCVDLTLRITREGDAA